MRRLALALSFASLAGAAQAEERPAAGTPQVIRLHLKNQDVLQGYLRGKSADEVVIYTSEARFRHIPLADVQRFEVRSRTGSHLKRGAVIGVAVWVGAVAAASRGALDKWGVASWQSGAILAGSIGAGALIGSQVPRYGWRATEASAIAQGAGGPGLHFTVRF